MTTLHRVLRLLDRQGPTSGPAIARAIWPVEVAHGSASRVGARRMRNLLREQLVEHSAGLYAISSAGRAVLRRGSA